jgi:hypothetical protein
MIGSLTNTSVDDLRAFIVLDSAAGRASSLDGDDDLHGLLISNLAEDNMAAVQPVGHGGGDEELRAVAADRALLTFVVNQ